MSEFDRATENGLAALMRALADTGTVWADGNTEGAGVSAKIAYARWNQKQRQDDFKRDAESEARLLIESVEGLSLTPRTSVAEINGIQHTIIEILDQREGAWLVRAVRSSVVASVRRERAGKRY